MKTSQADIKTILALPAEKAAPLLLGWELVRIVPDGELRLKIVEVEAYHQNDPASHSFRGKTLRTEPMFKAGGHIYIYFTYGMHYAINIITGAEGVGEGVLLRAAEPMEGIEIMKRNRNTENIHQLANGPGKLAQALGIKDTSLSGKILDKSTIFLQQSDKPVKTEDIIVSPRIGITKATDVDWRFYLKDSLFVSKR